MALLELLDVEGGDAEDSATVTETWYCEFADVASGYSLAYPAVGVPWSENSSYICTAVQYSRENKKYYSATNSAKNGADVVLLKATYTINYEMPDEEENPFQMRIASAGYQTYKINSGGSWGIIQKPCGWEAGVYELKLPVLQIDMTTVFVSPDPLDDAWYGAYVGALNDIAFLGRARGCVMFDSFTMVPKFGASGLQETELTLVFKVLQQDWNWEFRNPVQAHFKGDSKGMLWQNEFPNRPNYTTDATKVNMPVWSGEVLGYGDPAYGSGGWDFRVFGTDPVSGLPLCMYKYADLNDLLAGPSVGGAS